MTFAENINRICKARGVTLTAFIKSLGMSTSKVTAINNGSLPKETEMVLFAQKLNCSVMDFFADAEDLSPEVQSKDEDEQDILRVYRSLSRRAKHEFMSMVYDFENREELEGDKDNTAAV
jgi:hypothetical protein